MKINALWMVGLLMLAGCNQAKMDLRPSAIYYGDSVSLGAVKPLEQDLAKDVDVTHNSTDGVYANDGCSRTLLTSMQQSLPGTHYTIVIFNTGLHDLQTKVSPFGCGLTSYEEYRSNLEKIAALVEQNAAYGIWVNTTPVPYGAYIRPYGSQVPYNQIADDVAREHGFTILETGSYGQLPANVHFSQAGYDALASNIADCVRLVLNGEESDSCHH